MKIDIDPSMLDGLVRAWLKDTLKTLDYKTYKKDIKAVKRLLDYVGHHE